MTVYLTCLASVMACIIFLGLKCLNASREDTWKQHALDDERSVQMMESRLALGMERDLFDTTV